MQGHYWDGRPIGVLGPETYIAPRYLNGQRIESPTIQLMVASRKLFNKKPLVSSAKYSEHWASGEVVSVAKIEAEKSPDILPASAFSQGLTVSQSVNRTTLTDQNFHYYQTQSSRGLSRHMTRSPYLMGRAKECANVKEILRRSDLLLVSRHLTRLVEKKSS
jgi:hypothetical protein